MNQTTTPPHKPTHKPKTSDLLASAKVVASAAKATVSHDNNTKVDKAKVAGATADLLGAAKHYGKLEEKNYGKFVDKAESYLHKYQSSSSTTTTTTSSTTSSSHTNQSHQQSSGGGYGDYIKMAGGLLGKHGGGDGQSGGGGGGYGDYLKKAEGFLKKH